MDEKSLPLPLYRASQVRELDRIAIEEEGIAGICLMERAGKAIFTLLSSHWPQAYRIIVLCGTGNNGGDGYVLARLAYLAGHSITVLQVGEMSRLKGDARLAFEAMTQVGLKTQPFSESQLLEGDVLVDALLGTGLDREVAGKWRTVIEAVNRRTCPLIAVDIPSGLQADTGTVLGVAVKADITVTFIGLKQGLLTGMGPDYCGKVYFDDLQVPATIYQSIHSTVTRLDDDCLKTALPERSRTAHKGQFGHVLIIGGDNGMTGAVRMAAEAAARVGAGLISVATRHAHAIGLNLTRPEIMSHGVETVEELTVLLDKITVIAIGPGLGQSSWGHTLLEAVKTIKKPIIIDADALNLLAQTPFHFSNNIILTPHPGEAARLLKISTADIQADRFAAIRDLQHRFGGIWVLKGSGTLVVNVDDQISLCTRGNPGMASGGMGDILTGVIAGILAQGFSTFEAANLGVYLHAKAADQAAQIGERGLLATDLLPWLRHYANPNGITHQ